MKFSLRQGPDPDIAYSKTKLDLSLPPQNRAAGTESYLLGVEERSAPGILIGDMGCHHASPGEEEIGYMFLEGFWGQGYATEALRAYMEHYWSFERLEYEVVDNSMKKAGGSASVAVQPEVLRATIEAANEGSQSLLRKCGFQETRRYLHENRVWRVDFEIPRPVGQTSE